VKGQMSRHHPIFIPRSFDRLTLVHAALMFSSPEVHVGTLQTFS
jgi:hypothetical protein